MALPLAGFLIGLVTPIARKVLVALGIGLVTYVGYSQLIDQVKSHIITQMSGLPAKTMQIITLYGLPESLAIILGAFTTAASISALKKFKVL